MTYKIANIINTQRLKWVSVFLLAGASMNIQAKPLDYEKPTADIEGPRSCFWNRGPFSADPYINVAYPDANVFYWAATFTIPKGAKLEVDGEFAHARYQSLISYDERGRPQDSVADYLIAPKLNNTNPYQTGADRQAEERSYSIAVQTGMPPQIERGVMQRNTVRTDIYAPSYRKDQQLLIYRIYLPDEKASITGGVPLPEPVLTLSDGKRLRGGEACAALKTGQQLKIDPNALNISAEKYVALRDQADKPATWPATNPSSWYIQYDREFLLSMYSGEKVKMGRRSEGGFYPNLDNNYIRTIVNRKFGKVLVLRAKMPNISKSFYGERKHADADLRYWSICSNQSFANTRVTDCLFDEEVPLDKNGYYTIVVSREEDRPRNAKRECGVAWLEMAEDGDGLGDEDMAVVQIRNLLASPDFPHAVQKILKPGDEKAVMQEYFPKSHYMMPSMFEAVFPCI
ncbi:hypothetical protein [Shewanella woodyi]|uniref:DUF3857 domain-containing protein n=1 Tax=Shewanella woodyi (strain ATCC 51908 / MS32) TaxID=392500 RepID=B1KL00_SHEWM|nr:hypothetical protein [Shewanella woodyi]ACA88806.1 conserved hypothetical protein [Shewanella woodyi ATCC 51908]